jgi:phosphotriesterase-related protein
MTVNGKVNIDEIKYVDSHSHLITFPPENLIKESMDLQIDNPKKIKTDIETFKSLGGNTIVEMTTIDYGRNMELMKEVSDLYNINVIACSGFNKGAYNRKFLENKKINDVVEDLMKDINNDGIKPGVIKIGTSKNIIEPYEEIGLRAISRAHLKTGIPISTHTQNGTMALEQLKIFEEEKVPYENIVICHLDQNEDINIHRYLLEKGVFLSYDSISKQKYNTRERSIEFIVQFVREGLYRNILLGNDFARRSNFVSYGGNPGYESVFKYFKEELTEKLLENEMDVETIINDLYCENPKRAFCFREITNE